MRAVTRYTGLHFIPLTIFFSIPILFAITYAMAVSLGHINPFVAYISDTGAMLPEMNLFRSGLCFAMILIFMFIYVRYEEVKEFLRLHEWEGRCCCRSSTLNWTGLHSGYIAGLGIGLVVALKETKYVSLHMYGVFLVFLGGSVAFIIQGILSRRMVPQMCSNQMALLRILIGVLCILLYMVCQVTEVISIIQFTGNATEILRWRPHHGGWEMRVTSTVTEWIMFAFFQLYFLTFVSEFKRIQYILPLFQLILLIESRETQTADDDDDGVDDDDGYDDYNGDDGQVLGPTYKALASNKVRPAEHIGTEDGSNNNPVNIEC